MPYCSTVKSPPLMLKLRAYWNIVGFKEGSIEKFRGDRRNVNLIFESDVALLCSSISEYGGLRSHIITSVTVTDPVFKPLKNKFIENKFNLDLQCLCQASKTSPLVYR